MMSPEDEILKNLLLTEELIDEEQLIELEEEYKRTGRQFQNILIDYDIIDLDQLLELIAGHIGTDVVNIADMEIDHKIIDLISADYARMYGTIPFEADENTVKVVCSNPLDYKIADELSFMLEKDVLVYVARETQIENAIEKYYPTESMGDMLNDLDINIGSEEEEDWDTDDLENMANDTPIIRFVDVVLFQAIKDKASDVHFEPFETSFKIRYRLDGVLYEMSPPPKNLAVPVISRIKIMSGLNIAERRIPQDGRIQVRVAGKMIDLRVSTIPTQFGESVVLRILDRSTVNLDLDMLGMNEDIIAQIRSVISLPNGIFLVTGPTGSGKTTTLYSSLKEVSAPEVKVLTAEDPVEYDLEGIIQLPVNNTVGMTFARALRAFLRQDPDIIMVGEIRDLETAQMAIQASLTGHFVFSTLHTKEAADTITRLIDMGVKPFLLNSSLVGVLSQRLIRKVCDACKYEYDPTDEELELLDIERFEIGKGKFYKGKGCAMCNSTGYKGRKAIIEMLKVTPEICDLITKYSPTAVIRRKAKEQGMVSIREDGIKAILNGETTVEEVVKYT
ncbi:MAG: GspE/PulE family protein [Victivallales bacterium]|nr:GspE/PulE family protein [Victivallales bacterium]